MSITSILRGNDFPRLRECIQDRTPERSSFVSSTGLPPFSRDIPLLVPGTTSTTYDTALAGEISDYAFCLEILRFVERNREAVFEHFFEPVQVNVGLIIQAEPMKWRAHQREFDALLDGCLRYIHGAEVSIEQLIRYADQLNKLCHYHHAPSDHRLRFWETFSEPCSPEVEGDTAELIRVFRKTFLAGGVLNKDSVISLHPTLAVRTSPIGIPDLYADGIFYDFKSNKRMGYNWTEAAQVYCYHMLQELYLRFEPEELERTGIPPEPLKGIALYFSRYGDLETCELRSPRHLYPQELDTLADLMDEHYRGTKSKGREMMLDTLAKIECDRFLGRLLRGESRPEPPEFTPGDRVYAYKQGWGTVLECLDADGTRKVKVAFETGKTLQGDPKKVILLRRADLEQNPIIRDCYDPPPSCLFVPETE